MRYFGKQEAPEDLVQKSYIDNQPDTLFIQYISAYGTPPAMRTVYSGTQLSEDMLPNMTFGDYEFQGWYNYDKTRQYVVGDVINENTTLYAKWKVEPVTITYDTEFAPVDPKQIDKGAMLSVNELPALEHEGYQFGGWYLDSAYSQPAYIGYAVNNDITLHAKWIDVRKTITYISEHLTPPETKKVPSGYKLLEEDLPDMSEGKLRHDGWWNPEGTHKYQPGEEITDDTVLVAKWDELVDIVYETEHGTAPATKTVAKGYVMTADDLPSIDEPGYTFNGWYIGAQKIEAGYVVQGDITLTARFGEQYIISYNTEYGTAPDDKMVEDGYTLVAADVPTLEDEDDMIFNGWFSDAEGQGTHYEPGYVVHGNITMIAYWKPEVEWVPWSTGTDEQILAMIQAADRGEIDLRDFWTVGEERKVNLAAMSATGVGESHAAQEVTFVLMDATLTGLTPADSSKPLHFAVGLKDSLNEAGYMNSSNTNTGGWRDSKRRTWCNDVFANALPATFKQCFRQFKWQTGKGGGASSGLYETTDLFALPAEKMIFGSRSYSFSDEAALYNLWKWYETSANRIKKRDDSASLWWEASPYSGGSSHFCGVYSDGNAYGNFASYPRGLAPFGCI